MIFFQKVNLVKLENYYYSCTSRHRDLNTQGYCNNIIILPSPTLSQFR